MLVDDDLIAAEHADDKINWKSFGAFGCYHADKYEECVFVFCFKCH